MVRLLTDRELREVVVRARVGEASLEVAVEEALFGGEPPPVLWGDWPAAARESWDRAVALYSLGLRLETVLTPEGVWVAVRQLVVVERWPETPWLSLTRLSALLSCKPTVAGYQMKKQGWRWRGRYSVRRVESAPCLSCGGARPAVAVDPETGVCRECGG